jgi:two-component system sensor histidine kinase KdpD
MERPFTPYLLALSAVALVAWLSVSFLPVLGLVSAALLFQLPVLLASVRWGVGPGLLAALSGAAAYNYFLLPPRHTFLIHGFDNIVSVVVLVIVALVTSRLATRLEARRLEAVAQARASDEAAELASVLAKGRSEQAVASGSEWISERYGALQLIADDSLPENDSRFGSLDLSAAAWAMHNCDITGHGTGIMPAADWTFIPLAPHSRGDSNVAALARPASGMFRTETELAQLQQLVRLLGQAWDRAALGRERRERERLEDSDRLRRSLVASLAHDLRTPLTVIAGQLEGFARTTPEAGEALAAVRRLDRMMEDLLGTARLESGLVRPKLESLDLVDAVTTACETVIAPPAIELKRSIPADLPFVCADPVLLHHILLNLLDNAVRHATKNVSLAALPSSGAVMLSVCDDGPGIPVEQRDRIFERFVRLEGSDREHGSGLGLAIVKGFANAMGIGVTATESSGGGGRFDLVFPCSGARS